MAEHQQNETAIAGLQAQLADLTGKFMAISDDYERLKKSSGSVVILEPGEAPVYEVGGTGFFSSDCIYYPAGAQFEDITGQLVPNEELIPLNMPAEDRMRAYLQRLPNGQRTPSLDLIIEASMAMSPGKTDDPKAKAEYHGRVLQRALELQWQQNGLLPGDHPRPAEIRLPQRSGNVPMMGNTKVVGQQTVRPVTATRGRDAPEKIAPQMPSRSDLLASTAAVRTGALGR